MPGPLCVDPHATAWAGVAGPADVIQVMKGIENIGRSFAGNCAVCHGELLQGAAQGVAVHPRYRTNGWIYLSWGELCDDCPRTDLKNPLVPSMTKVFRGRMAVDDDGRIPGNNPYVNRLDPAAVAGEGQRRRAPRRRRCGTAGSWLQKRWRTVAPIVRCSPKMSSLKKPMLLM